MRKMCDSGILQKVAISNKSKDWWQWFEPFHMVECKLDNTKLKTCHFCAWWLI